MSRKETLAAVATLVLLTIEGTCFGLTPTSPHPTGPVHSNSVLAKLAATMQPGTFALLNRHGDESGYSWELVDGRAPNGHGVGSIFGYSQKAAYDPVTDTIFFSGGAHDGVTETIRYDIASNRWTNEGPLPPGFRWGHSYDSNTLNPAAREFYASSQLLSYTLRRYNIETRTWQTMAQPQSVRFGPGEASAEYFPDRDELVWVQDRAIGVWKQSEDKWCRVASLPGLAFRSPVARYIPAHKCVLILGGADTTKTPAVFAHAVYKYDAEGKITQLKDSPPSIKVYINRALIAVDPVTSECLFIQAVLGNDINDFTGRIEFWKYNIGTDEWTQLDESVVPRGWWQLSYPFAVVATPIPKYGVIMYMSAAGKNSSVYLYKGGSSHRKSTP